MTERPTGTVTFLFTDIEGSTRLWDESPDAMKATLAVHDGIVRSAVERNGGHLFATGGDGFAIAFNRPDEAAATAVEVQSQLGDLRGQVPLRVRMGMHTGVADERDGDYFGAVPTRAARIMGAAWGGQILCSDVTRRLLPSGGGLRSLGEHRLRDLSEPSLLWEISTGDHEFPPIRTVNAVDGNLPTSRTSLIARDELVADITDRLATNRTVTLTGVGGVGKTRTALQVAGDLSPDFADGCWLVELAPVLDADSVADAIVGALRIAPRPGVGALASAIDHLRGLELLILLDNCEHLTVAAGRVVEEIIRTTERVAVLATSREGLGVAGEQILAIPSLPCVADDGDWTSVPAVQLFVDRARELGGWEPTSDDLSDVGELCRHLDGIPLAIELAAGRATVLTPQQMIGLLDDRFRLLTGRQSGRLERHKTLRTAVEWSYDLLEVEEQHAFDRLGVFVGSFDLAAATAAMRHDDDSMAAIETLSSLMSRSLLQLDRSGGSQRYRLLETLRQLAIEHLADDGIVDEARIRHATHFASESERLGALLRSADELNARLELMAHLPDLRAAVSSALDRDDTALAARLIGPYYAGPASVIHDITSMADSVVERVQDDPIWGGATATVAGWHAYVLSDTAAVEGHLERLRDIAARDERAAAESWRTIAALSSLVGRGDDAIDAAARAVTIASDSGEVYQATNARCSEAGWRAAFGDPRPALAERVLDEAGALGSPPFIVGYGTMILAFSSELANPERALEIIDRHRTSRPDPLDTAAASTELVAGRILLRRRDHLDALECLLVSLELTVRDGMRTEFRYAAATAAGCLAPLGHAREAALIFAATAGSPWANQADAEGVASQLIDEHLESETRSRLTAEGQRMSFEDAAELTMATVSEALEQRSPLA